jgi:hypothetical protein
VAFAHADTCYRNGATPIHPNVTVELTIQCSIYYMRAQTHNFKEATVNLTRLKRLEKLPLNG